MDKVTEIEIDAVYAFVQAKLPYAGGRIGRILRTITEAIQFERFVGSTGAKRINTIMSRRAADLMAVNTSDQFVKETILEHTKPLSRLYAELLEMRQQLTPERLQTLLIDQMKVFPLVTITRKEDEGLRNNLEPYERYRIAGIEVGKVAHIAWGKQPEWEVIPHALRIIVENEQDRRRDQVCECDVEVRDDRTSSKEGA